MNLVIQTFSSARICGFHRKRSARGRKNVEKNLRRASFARNSSGTVLNLHAEWIRKNHC
jgi:hypothetical protein